jgi:hypothetical protein
VVYQIKERFTIDYLWVLFVRDGLNVGFDVLFDDTLDWNGMQKKLGEVNIMKIDILWQKTRLSSDVSAGVC